MRQAAMLAVAALAGCASATNDRAGISSPRDARFAAPMPTDAATYVQIAGASDLFEIRSSQLALSRAARADTRQYAGLLVTHHSQTSQATAQAALVAGQTPPPPMLTRPQQRMLDQLLRAEPGKFDALYFEQQIPAHETALALHSSYASNGDVPALRASAAAAVPVVRRHLEEARRLAVQRKRGCLTRDRTYVAVQQAY